MKYTSPPLWPIQIGIHCPIVTYIRPLVIHLVVTKSLIITNINNNNLISYILFICVHSLWESLCISSRNNNLELGSTFSKNIACFSHVQSTDHHAIVY